MRMIRMRMILLAGFCSLVVFSFQPRLWAQGNLAKDIEAKKEKINWKPASGASLIPTQVCDLLQVCAGTEKYAALPRATEGGQIVGRILYQTQDQKHADVYILSHQTLTERYYFLLSADGGLAKTAYGQLGPTGSANWVEMGSATAGPVFDKDKTTWNMALQKLGEAPEKKSESAAKSSTTASK